MDAKLTLKLDEEIIEKAKAFAKAKSISLSGLIENYLQKLTTDSGDEKITPLVKSLSGIIDLPKITVIKMNIPTISLINTNNGESICRHRYYSRSLSST